MIKVSFYSKMITRLLLYFLSHVTHIWYDRYAWLNVPRCWLSHSLCLTFNQNYVTVWVFFFHFFCSYIWHLLVIIYHSLYICHSQLFKYIEFSALRFISQFNEWNLCMHSLQKFLLSSSPLSKTIYQCWKIRSLPTPNIYGIY